MTELHIVVPGNPVPKSRPRFTRSGRTYSVKSQVVHEDTIGWSLRAVLGHRRFEGPVHIHCLFVRKNRHAVDLDNLLKLVFDAANGVAWEDDRQVVKAIAGIEVDRDNPRTEITISSAPPKEG